MLNSILFGIRYLAYLFFSSSKHGVHSPFVYDFITNVLEKSNRENQKFHGIEFLRYRMLKSKSLIQVEDFGTTRGTYNRKLSSVVKRSAKIAKYSRLLFRICEYYQPRIALEIGTNVGISGMYQASAIPEGYLFTLEGSSSFCDIASFNFNRLGLQNVQVIKGEFDKTLPLVTSKLPQLDYVFFDGNHSMEATLKYFNTCKELAHNNSIFIFDDINWSEDMRECWERIKLDPKVKISIDLFAMGIVFFRSENEEKEHFKLRY